MDLSRRELMQAAAVLGVAGAASTTVAAQAGQLVRLREGTNISLALSKDGKWLATDLVASIWVLPADGGTARRLTGQLQDATLPSWAPDGSLVFQSYRDGNFHLYQVKLEGGEPHQLTSGKFDHREPAVSPDGKRVALTSDRGGSYGVWLLDLGSGDLRQLTPAPDEVSAPQWSSDGQRLIFTVGDAAIDVLAVASGERVRVVTAPQGARVFGAAFGPDGKPSYTVMRPGRADLMLGDQALTSGEDVFGFAPVWAGSDVLYTADGKIRRRGASGARDIPFAALVPVAKPLTHRRIREVQPGPVRGIASPVVSPDGKQIAFRALNAVHVVASTGGAPRKLTSGGFFDSDPDFTPDGRSLVYSSDRLGVPALRRYDLTTGADTPLGSAPGAQTAPRFSPDGRKIAYHDHDGVTWILDVATGARQQATPALFMPGRPTWSPDGTVLALAAVKPSSRRFREGTSQILTVHLTTGELRYTEPMPFRSLATRGDDGPVWSPDGRHLAFVVESVAWVVPVDAAGRFLGDPRQVTHEVTDSPAWHGSTTLLYLCNGKLRRVSLEGGEPKTIRLDFSWHRPKPPQRTVIHAGAVWDGESERLRTDVDIVVERGRVLEIRPHRAAPGTVDAGDLVAMPGLIDAHNHWHLRGRAWGARQGRLWLAYGITTTRSPGDPAYQMVETREALAAGTLVGPRFFGTGEAIDGSRVYYNFMRPTLSRQQLDLELKRALELDYDMIKTYVRLPVDLQQQAVLAAHRVGVPLSSHYLYPAASFGMDGMEHVGATNRLGYSHTVTRAYGRAYSDVVDLFVRSGMSMTPTLFHSHALYAEDKSLVTDERTRVLFPPWEYERLVADANSAGTPASQWSRDILSGWVNLALRVHRAGGLVLNGTDTPLDTIGTATHMNLRAMVAFGFTPREALITATRNPAQWLDQTGKIGVLKPGAHADISFVVGNPLEDIRNAAVVRRVMVGGVLHDVDSLLAPYRTPAASTFSAPLPALPSAARRPEHWWHEPEWSAHVCCGEH